MLYTFDVFISHCERDDDQFNQTNGVSFGSVYVCEPILLVSVKAFQYTPRSTPVLEQIKSLNQHRSAPMDPNSIRDFGIQLVVHH
jgi:hypothetical protein